MRGSGKFFVNVFTVANIHKSNGVFYNENANPISADPYAIGGFIIFHLFKIGNVRLSFGLDNIFKGIAYSLPKFSSLIASKCFSYFLEKSTFI